MVHSQPRAGTALQIAESLERGIREGQFERRGTLPPVRELAASLKVSPATVNAAYRLLRTRGLVVGDRRRGTRVRPETIFHRPSHRSRGEGLGLVDLATGHPDPSLLPSLAAALGTISAQRLEYAAVPEHRGLTTFAKAEMAADGLAVDELVVTNGALDAIDRLLREHLHPGNRVVVEDPGYPILNDLLAASGYVTEPVAIDANGPDPDALERVLARKPQALIVTPRGQNPTGAAITTERSEALRAILKRHRDVLLIENDPLGPISGAPPVTLAGDRKHWAVVRSTSKFLGPDLRLAIVAGDATSLARVRGRQALGVRWVSHLLQELALALWSDPGSGRLFARAAAVYAHRRAGLVRALAERGIHISAASGFNVWIPVRHEATVIERLTQTGWAVAAGDRFRLASGPGIRITTSVLDAEASARLARDLSLAIDVAPSLPA